MAKAAVRRKAFDWKDPEPGYALIWAQRAERLRKIRQMPKAERDAYVSALKDYYRDGHEADFIIDWGVTVDPRRVELGLDSMMPFVMFPKQREFIETVVWHWKNRKPLICDKSRDGGLSWLAIALGCTLCILHPGMIVGYGSRVEDLVDKIGEPKSLFWKARIFMQELPREFKGTWDENRHAPHMRILFPDNGSVMSGEAGKQIGRGGRTGITFVDEASHLENPQSVDMALSQTTNCRIDISTPNGLANSFAQRRHSGKIDVFTLHWRDDPRKDEAWYEKQCSELDPVTVAQEIDINYSASVEGVVIPHEWILAAIDADKKLGLVVTGERSAALDIADEGVDKNALCAAHGVVLTDLEEWSGVGSDIFDSVERAFNLCDKNGVTFLKYDSDGLGAGARGDGRILNAARKTAHIHEITMSAWRGSQSVFNPLGEDVKGRKNQDFFKNRKAQGWWALRTRFRNTFRLVREGIACSHDDIICLPAHVPNHLRLIGELSQPTFTTDNVGKIVINKAPNGTKSPNLADAVMMKFANVERGPMKISGEVLAAAKMLRRPRR